MSTHSFLTYIEDAEASDSWPLFTTGPAGGKLARVTHKVTGSSTPTVDFNLEKRNEDDPFSAGTGVWSGDKTADTSSTVETSFDAGDISARQSVWYVASAKTGTVSKVMISGEWKDPDVLVTLTRPGKLDYRGSIPTILIADVTIDILPVEPGKIDYAGPRAEYLAGGVKRRYASFAARARDTRVPGTRDVRNQPPAGQWNP